MGKITHSLHLAHSVHVYTHVLIVVIDVKGSRIGRARVVELAEGIVFQQEAHDIAIGGCQETDNVTMVVGWTIPSVFSSFTNRQSAL